MTKHVKLSGPVYESSDHLRIDITFDRDRGGYLAVCTPVEKNSIGYAMTIDSNYFAIQRKMSELVVPAARRNAKKQAEADALLNNPAPLVDAFLARIGRSDLEVVGVE